jgi:hypothetical protein
MIMADDRKKRIEAEVAKRLFRKPVGIVEMFDDEKPPEPQILPLEALTASRKAKGLISGPFVQAPVLPKALGKSGKPKKAPGVLTPGMIYRRIENARLRGPALVDEGLAVLPLPVTPDGKPNRYSMSLAGNWMLECAVDSILRNPEIRKIIKARKRGESITFDPLEFRMNTRANRKRLGRKATDKVQLKGWNELKKWPIVIVWVWNPDKPTVKRKGGWEGIEVSNEEQLMSAAHGQPFLIDWDEREWKRVGRPDKEGNRTSWDLSGKIHPVSGAALVVNATMEKYFRLPVDIYRMGFDAQLLFRLGRNKVRLAKGWFLTHSTARILLPGKQHSGRFNQRVEKALDEVCSAVGWERDLELERGKRVRHEIGLASKMGWILRQGRPKLPH